MPSFEFDLQQDLSLPQVPHEAVEPREPPSDASKTKCNNVKATNCVKVMYDLAEDPAVDSVCFSAFDQGRHLVVRNAASLEALLEAKGTFRSSKWAALVRNLNYNSFKKLREVDMGAALKNEFDRFPGFHAFTHEHFVRGRPDLMARIKTQSAAKGKDKEHTSPEAQLADLKKQFEAQRLDFERVIAAKDALIEAQQVELEASLKRGRGGEDDDNNGSTGKRARHFPDTPPRPKLSFRMSQDDGTSSEAGSEDDFLGDLDFDGITDDCKSKSDGLEPPRPPASGQAMAVALTPSAVLSVVTSSFQIVSGVPASSAVDLGLEDLSRMFLGDDAGGAWGYLATPSSQ